MRTIRVLGLDTAANTVSAAVISDGRLDGEWTVRAPRRASRLFPSSIARWLEDLALTLRDIEGIAVTVGPGSYTGLRIGTALALGVVLAQKIPAAAVISTAALAAQVPSPPDGHIVSVVSAGRGGGFSALYRRPAGEHGGIPLELVGPARRSRTETEALVRDLVPAEARVICAGDAEEAVEAAGVRGAEQIIMPIRAAAVARLGWLEVRRGESCPPHRLHPRYFRRTAVERGAET